MNIKLVVLISLCLFSGLKGVQAEDTVQSKVLQFFSTIFQNFLDQLKSIFKQSTNLRETTSTSTILRETTSTSTVKTTTDPYGYNGFRLPNNILPINYNLTIKAFYSSNLQPDENFFDGSVKIKFKLTSPTNMIIFHADPSLKIIGQINLVNLATGESTKIIYSRYLPNQLYQIVLDKIIPIQEYLMTISFKNDYGSESNLVGFHKINYVENGITKIMLSTKFQPVDARRAFPCFDEPSLKATFDLTLEHPNDSIALGNWPEIFKENFIENGKNRLKTKFATTYKMSTYLLAWFIGPLDYISESTLSANNIPIKVWGTKTNINNGYLNFALEVAKKSIDFLENDYMKISEPIPPKFDLLSIPRTQSGASENWGLINLRENLLLYSDKETKLTHKQLIAITLAHEISHFWFGNYLTIKFWDAAWLKEAMSNYLAYKILQNIYPEFDQMRQYINIAKIPIMMEDSYSTTLPVSVKAENLTPEEIFNFFTTITYDKGLSILVMLEDIIGEEKFSDSLRKLQQDFRFGVIDSDMYYESIILPSEFHNITTKSFIEKWLYQKNFPEIKVQLNYTQTQPSVNFEQKVFLFDQQKEGQQNNDEWIVYLKCKVGGDVNLGHFSGNTREFKYVLDKKQGIFKLDRNYSWIKCNSDFRGYYLVNYEGRNLDILNQILAYNYSAFSTEDRAGIVFETYFQALKGDKSYNQIKNITKLVTTNENTYITWNALLWNLKKLKTLTEFRPSFKELSDYFIPLLTNKYSFDELWNDSYDVHSVQQIKGEIFDALCEMESEKCILKAKELFDLIPSEYFINPEPNSKLNKLSQNQRAIIYKYAIKNSDKNENWYKLLNLYFNSVSPSERENALNGLTSSTKIWQFETLYNEAFKQESKIRAEDFFSIMTLIGKNVQGRDFFWRKFRSEFFKIGNKFGFNIFLILTLKDVAQNFENTLMLNELIANFSLDQPLVAIFVQHIKSYIMHNIYWTENLESDLLKLIKV